MRASAAQRRAFRQRLSPSSWRFPAAFIVATDAWRRVFLIGVILLLMIVELLNTAVEKLPTTSRRTHHDAIGRIKDMASAAVGLSLLLAGIVWLVALAERVGLI